MATRQERLEEFRQDAPPPDLAVVLLCEDHCGTYALPFACSWSGGKWRNSVTGAIIDVSVIGWRSR